MNCIACSKSIELTNVDPLLELCNKCYGISLQAARELIEQYEDQQYQKALKEKQNQQNQKK